MHVEIYFSKVCKLCTEAIHYFHKRGESFTAYAIDYDKEADEFVDSENTRAMYERCGEKVEFVPQIFIKGKHIGGWRKLEPMIESGEVDQLLKQG